jgi:hypothetical protein
MDASGRVLAMERLVEGPDVWLGSCAGRQRRRLNHPPGGGSVSGPEIISNTGKVIWFRPLPAHELAADFRTQTYQGKPVLTWWQGPPNLGAVSGGTDYIYSDRYQKIAEVRGGNGYTVDGQEFLITPWNTARITADTITTANLTSIGGPADRKVVDSIVQEIDISTGKVLFQWNAADHVPYQYSEQPRPASAATPWTGSTSTPSTSTPTGTC